MKCSFEIKKLFYLGDILWKSYPKEFYLQLYKYMLNKAWNIKTKNSQKTYFNKQYYNET